MLLNRERVGERGVRDRGASRAKNGRRGFEFGTPASNDVLYKGDCDTGVQELVRLLGWDAEFDALRRGSGVAVAAATLISERCPMSVR